MRRRGQRCGSHPSLSFKELAKDYRNLPEDEKERLRVIGNLSIATHRVVGLYHGKRSRETVASVQGDLTRRRVDAQDLVQAGQVGLSYTVHSEVLQVSKAGSVSAFDSVVALLHASDRVFGRCGQ